MPAKVDPLFSSTDGRPNTACEPSIRPDYSAELLAAWLRRHLEFVQIAGRGGIDVLFIGDSITDYWRSVGLSSWERNFATMRAANFGISGDRTQQVLWRIAHGELDGLEPRVVVLLIGTNNMDPGLGENSLTPSNTPTEIVAGVAAVVRSIRRHLPGSIVLLHGLFPRGESAEPVRHIVREINSSLSALAKADTKVRFLDLGEKFIAADGTLAPAVSSDHLHLSAIGYEIWAAELEEEFSFLLKKKVSEIKTP